MCYNQYIRKGLKMKINVHHGKKEGMLEVKCRGVEVIISRGISFTLRLTGLEAEHLQVALRNARSDANLALYRRMEKIK